MTLPRNRDDTADQSPSHGNSGSARVRRLVWLTVGPTACGSYRCYVPSLTLARTGRYTSRFIDISHCASPTPTQRRILCGADVVILQRHLGDSGPAWARACIDDGVPLVFELDDDVLHVPRRHPCHVDLASAAVRRALTRIVADSVHVITSTEVLANALRAAYVLPGDRISVGCNHLHEFVWARSTEPPMRSDDGVTIGWQGTPTHDEDFEVVVPALRDLLGAFPSLRLAFFGQVPLPARAALPSDRMSLLPPVVFQHYPAALRAAGFDIGIAPLADNSFNAAKSNVKWLEYSACRVPTVASAVGPYATSIVDGQTGLLASTTADWREHLTALVRNPTLRLGLANHAHDDVWRHWSADRRGAVWVDIFDRVCGSRCVD